MVSFGMRADVFYTSKHPNFVLFNESLLMIFIVIHNTNTPPSLTKMTRWVDGKLNYHLEWPYRYLYISACSFGSMHCCNGYYTRWYCILVGSCDTVATSATDNWSTIHNKCRVCALYERASLVIHASRLPSTGTPPVATSMIVQLILIDPCCMY